MISCGKGLSPHFKKYIENTTNIFVYKLGDHHIPSNIVFPNATTTTIINCNKKGIFNILSVNTFPNIQEINYISMHPGDYNIYKRFGKHVKWIFPEKEYDFYDHIIKQNRGTKDKGLISRYLKNKRIIDSSNEFDVSFYFDLYIPNYGIIDGEWYRYQFYEYCVEKQNEFYKQEDAELI